MPEERPLNEGLPPAQDPEDVEAVISKHPFLAGLAREHLAVLAANALRVQYAPGTLIFRKGDPANRFYLLESGNVSLEDPRPGSSPAQLQTIGPGDVLGWSWLFPPYAWEFDARAIEPITAIFFYGTRLREACEEDHHLGYELMKRTAAVIIDRLQNVRKRLLAATRPK